MRERETQHELRRPETCNFLSYMAIEDRVFALRAYLPRLLLRDPEISGLVGVLSKANIVIMATNEFIAEGLQAGEKE